MTAERGTDGTTRAGLLSAAVAAGSAPLRLPAAAAFRRLRGEPGSRARRRRHADRSRTRRSRPSGRRAPGLRLVRVEDRRNRRALSLGAARSRSRSRGASSSTPPRCAWSGPPRVEDLSADPRRPAASERLPGREDRRRRSRTRRDGFAVAWRAVLREGSHYVRQEIDVLARADVAAPGDRPRRPRGAGRRGRAARSRAHRSSPETGSSASSIRSPTRPPDGARAARSTGRCRFRPARPFRYSCVVGACRERADAPRLSRLRRAGARAPVRNVPPLQLLVRPRILHAVRRGGGARRHRDLRPGAAREARRRPGLLSLRRRLGRSPAVGIQRRIPAGLRAADRGRGPLWLGARSLALALGRLRKAAAGAPAVREGAGLRVERGRPRPLRARLLPTLSRGLPRFRAPLRRQPVQVRRHGKLREGLSGERLRQRLRGGDRADRRPARREARSLREPDDRNVPVALVAAATPTAIWRGGEDHDFAGVGLRPPALDHLPRRRHVPAHRPGGPALSAQLAHAARPDLRPAREEARDAIRAATSTRRSAPTSAPARSSRKCT